MSFALDFSGFLTFVTITTRLPVSNAVLRRQAIGWNAYGETSESQEAHSAKILKLFNLALQLSFGSQESKLDKGWLTSF